MQSFKKRNLLLVILLAVVLLIVLCCNLPSLLYSLRFPSLCLKQDLLRPPNTEILISACNKEERMRITVTPDGKALFVTKKSARNNISGNIPAPDEVYLLDLSTGEKRNVPVENLYWMEQGELLSSELFWWWVDPGYIIDMNDGQRYELIDLNQMPLLDKKFDPKNYRYFQSAEQVFILQDKNRVIALSPDFRQSPEGNVIYRKSSPNSDVKDGAMVEELMNDLGVKYKIVNFSNSYYYDLGVHLYFSDADIYSPTGKYVVRDNGIYFSETNNVVVFRDMSDFQGWYYDESAVVLRLEGYYLIDINGAFGSSLRYFYIPGPTLKLRLSIP
jgi:hypothetical protein